MSPGYKWPFFQPQKKKPTQRTVDSPLWKGQIPITSSQLSCSFRKSQTRVRRQQAQLFIPIGNGKLTRGGRPRGTPIADTRTLFSRQRGGGQCGFMTACSTRSFFQQEKKKRLREGKKAERRECRSLGLEEMCKGLWLPLIDPPSQTFLLWRTDCFNSNWGFK